MTQSEKIEKLEEITTMLHTIVIGNGIEGMAKKVQKHDKLYYKLMGAMAVLLASNGYLIFFR